METPASAQADVLRDAARSHFDQNNTNDGVSATIVLGNEIVEKYAMVIFGKPAKPYASPRFSTTSCIPSHSSHMLHIASFERSHGLLPSS